MGDTINKITNTFGDLVDNITSSTTFAAVASASSASFQSPRSKRRAEAINLVMDTPLGHERQKRLIKRFKGDSDLVETMLSVSSTGMREDLMRDYADESASP